jgi:hypothetical protein
VGGCRRSGRGGAAGIYECRVSILFGVGQTLARQPPILPRGKDDPGIGEGSLTSMWRGGGRAWGEWPPDEWSDREIALRIILYQAIINYKDRSRALTEREICEEEARWLGYAKQLRAMAKEIREYAESLEEIAGYCEHVSTDGWTMCSLTPGLLARRDHGNLRARGYCAYLTSTVRSVYGRPMRNAVAAIATCALELQVPVTEQNIRDWIPEEGVS